jgi:hypothetical protein
VWGTFCAINLECLWSLDGIQFTAKNLRRWIKQNLKWSVLFDWYVIPDSVKQITAEKREVAVDIDALFTHFCSNHLGAVVGSQG